MDVMTAPEKADGTATARADDRRQPSLLKLMSLQDFWRFMPETLGLLVIIVLVRGMVDSRLPDASSLDNAFWIPVLLMAAQYGIMGGLFAACSTSLLVLATELPKQSMAQDFYDYAAFAAAQPCAWFVAALVLGGLRTLHIHNQARVEDRLEETTAAAQELAQRLVGSSREMALLEERLAADTATAAVLLDAFARLDLSSGQALLSSFANIVRHAAGAESFTVLLKEGETFVSRFGYDNGMPISAAALALLPPVPTGLLGEGGSGAHDVRRVAKGLPIRMPIRMSNAAEPIGWLICSRITPAQTPAIAGRRLNEVCCVLAKLLPLSHGVVSKTASRSEAA